MDARMASLPGSLKADSVAGRSPISHVIKTKMFPVL